jgi:hypothetical protein
VLGRNHSNNPHVARIDDNHFVFIDEIEEAAPFGLDLHQCCGDWNDVDPAPRITVPTVTSKLTSLTRGAPRALMTVLRICVRCSSVSRACMPEAR